MARGSAARPLDLSPHLVPDSAVVVRHGRGAGVDAMEPRLGFGHHRRHLQRRDGCRILGDTMLVGGVVAAPVTFDGRPLVVGIHVAVGIAIAVTIAIATATAEPEDVERAATGPVAVPSGGAACAASALDSAATRSWLGHLRTKGDTSFISGLRRGRSSNVLLGHLWNRLADGALEGLVENAAR